MRIAAILIWVGSLGAALASKEYMVLYRIVTGVSCGWQVGQWMSQLLKGEK